MASELLCLFSSATPSLTSIIPRSSSSIISTHKTCSVTKPWRAVTCAVSNQQNSSQITTDEDDREISNSRRSANYQPNIWNFEFLQSVENDLKVAKLEERGKKLEEEVRGIMQRLIEEEEDKEPVRLLELIDNMQRLGLSYKFEDVIMKGLESIISSDYLSYSSSTSASLHPTALCFRLLRQHGFQVDADVFDERFKEKGGIGFRDEMKGDVEGLLSLYEASYLGFEGESVLEEARVFSATHLLKNQSAAAISSNKKMAERIGHALELPYHRRLQRLEARWFIENYQVKEPHDGVLLDLAKLDFNMVQSLYQRELRELSSWWREIGLASKLEFVRDRLMEVYFWAVGMAPDPQLSECRKAVTKMFGLVTIIDDVYDVYGTLEELQLFTDAVEAWDVNAVNKLPHYMKLCFLALYNTVNDTAYSILIKQNRDTNNLTYLAKSWSELCKAFLQEAKWSNNKVIPEFNKYLQNASISSSGVALLTPCYFSVSQDKQQEAALHSLINFEGLVRSPCTIFRLCNDLATSAAELERGETTNSITSYMQEKGSSEEEARDKLGHLIDLEWSKMNRDRVLDTSTFPKAFIEIAINMARVSHCTYQYGDGLGRPDNTAENRIKNLLIHPISII